MKYKAIPALLLSTLIFSAAAARLAAAPAFEDLGLAAGNAMPGVPEVSAPVKPPLRAGGALNSYFISVGQGDAEYIELPNGKNVLIDGGPNPNTSLSTFLSQHNVTHLDYVVLTHPHSDHYSGLTYVFNTVKVDNFYDTREENAGSSTIKKLREKVAALGTNVIYPAAGQELGWDPGEVEARVLNSCSEPGSSSDGHVLNDCSIVIKVTYQNTSILYAGDMEQDVEARLVSTYGDQLKSDVLKVGHHGSPTASSLPFLNAVKPRLAYIEVGTGNTFGFPAAVTLTNLQAIGAQIHRTDMEGTMVYTIGR